MRIRKRAAALGIALSLNAVSTASMADTVTGDKGSDMLLDLVVLRPIGLVSTIVGSAVFVVALPFTIPSGSVGASACELVERPAAYTFSRPLGDLEDDNGPSRVQCSHTEAK